MAIIYNTFGAEVKNKKDASYKEFTHVNAEHVFPLELKKY